MHFLSNHVRAAAIQRQVAFQLGDYRRLTGRLADSFASEAWRRSSLFAALDFETKSVYPAEEWAALVFDETKPKGQQWTYASGGKNSKGYRNADLLSSLFEYGLAADVAFDMQDGVANLSAEIPIFQYNRVARAVNAILWPLKGFQDIGDSRFAGSTPPDTLSFQQKESAVFWRGALVGHALVGGKKKNIQFVVQDYINGKIGRDALLAALSTVPRYRFVAENFGRRRFNVGFVFPKRLEYFTQVDEIKKLTCDFVSREDQLQFRYLMQVSGNDYATSFPWHSATNSLVIREAFAWEAFYDCHFQPWVHYVPVASGFVHLDRILDWLDSDPEHCEEMTRRSQASAMIIADQALRNEALLRVVESYNALYGRGHAARA